MAFKVMKVLVYISAWMDKHMDRNCVDDAAGSTEPPLYFMSTELIDGRHFCLQLHKEPLTNLLNKFTVTWLSHKDGEIPPLGVVITNVTNVGKGGVMYRCHLQTIKHVPGVLEYFFSLQVTRI